MIPLHLQRAQGFIEECFLLKCFLKLKGAKKLWHIVNSTPCCILLHTPIPYYSFKFVTHYIGNKSLYLLLRIVNP